MKFTNTTVQNRSKKPRLDSQHVIPFHHVSSSQVTNFLSQLSTHNCSKEQILYSIGVELLGSSENPAVKSFLEEYDIQKIQVPGIPKDSFDLLGSVYQFLNSKSENLEKGSFYTGSAIATDFVNDLDFRNGEIIFDPACGSGSFLFHSNAPAEQIVGVDFDPIAIMIAKFNYFLKFPNSEYPKIYCADFFEWYLLNQDLKFEYIIGNPPYGASLNLTKIPTEYINSGESFSYFLEICTRLLSRNGRLRFLLPEAALNVKRHADLRRFLLDKCNLTRIKQYSSKFAGVMSDTFMLEVDASIQTSIIFESSSSEEQIRVPKKLFRNLQNQVFVKLTKLDINIIEKVAALQVHSLAESIFGLGVVTGDNKNLMLSKMTLGAEPIFTGKQVEKYRLLPANTYLVFNRSDLQQVAPDEIYRAPEKLVYKTINKKLKFAYDDTGSLTSNSANIVIPDIPGYNILSVLALLNSDLYSFLHLKLFGGVNKIAKENLMALPFPSLNAKADKRLVSLVSEVLNGTSDSELQDFIHYDIFGLTENEVKYIGKAIA